MDKLSKLFFNQVSVLQKNLEHLLEKKPLKDAPEAPLEVKEPFQASTDLTQIDSLGVGLSKETVARVTMIFSRLAVYFDSGLLFQQISAGNKNTPSGGPPQPQWKTIAGFDSGDFFPLKGGEVALPFQFPQMTLIEVRKVNSPDIFSHLQKIQVIRNQNSDALIFKPHPDYIFMVTSTLGDPWLKTHIEKIQKEILLLLVDQF